MVSFSWQNTNAQKRCNAVEADKMLKLKYQFIPEEIEFEKRLAEKITARRNKLVPYGTNKVGDPDKIAIVVHIIHNGEPYGEGVNITDEQIISQIEVLNEDYQRQNADTINTQPEFLSVASKMNIEFVLARQTKDGDPTTGILRTEGTKASYGITVSERELLSSFSQWDPNIYLNIWVTNLTSPYIGLAQFPDLDFPGLGEEPNKDNEATDGMVIDYTAFGSIAKVPGLDLQPKYSLGRTSTHEIGHFLGLKHVWGDATGSAGCNVDDYVSDTPNSSNDYSGDCTPTDHLSCGTNDMFENYLYYTNDQCMNIFTAEQVVRMQTIMEDAPRRNSLLNSIGTEYPGNEYFDLAINEIKSPGIVLCDNEFDIVLEIKNNGTIPVVDFDIVYSINSQGKTYTYTGDTLFSGQVIEIQVDQLSVQNGSYFLTAILSNIPDDINNSNNKKDHAFVADNQQDFIPLREQFETIDLNSTAWISVNEDDKIGWEIAQAPLSTSENRAAFTNLFNYEEKRQQDWLISPALDFSGAIEASMFFRASYAKNQNFNDQLRVMASENCGASFDDILYVYTSNELSVTNSEDSWKPKGQNDWKTHSINLNEYAGKQNIRLAFMTINDFGNNLYLDDIEIFATDKDDVVKTAQNSFTLYPNPSDNGNVKLSFNTSERQDIVVFIYDQLGQLVTMNEYPNTLNQTYEYDLTGLRSGVYFINAKGKDFVRSKKLVLSR